MSVCIRQTTFALNGERPLRVNVSALNIGLVNSRFGSKAGMLRTLLPRRVHPRKRPCWNGGHHLRYGPSRDIAPRGVILRHLFHTDYFISR
jgi:hypothetical protein